jgi:hypothetical protein
MTKQSCTFAAAGTLVLLLLAPPSANAQSPPGGSEIGPRQVFGAHVNGSTGHPSPATILMACAGPIQPGKTGHPMAGQTVDVFLSDATSGLTGYTGPHGTHIGAFFGAPPPGAPSGAGYVDFDTYRARAIPTSETLPCSGSGTVTFVPLPLNGGSRDVSVPVEFVGQP